MHVAAREVKAKGRAYKAGGEPRCTHCSLRLWYTVSPLVYSKTDHSFHSILIQQDAEIKETLGDVSCSALKDLAFLGWDVPTE